ncbi:hypothetical protein COL922a_008584 [Colletotrichum nupharicola]|nr:hypothetical protein COL922a_008584 [Colletotrichum nupharicola]
MLHDLLVELDLLGTFEVLKNSTLIAMNDDAFEYLANWGMNLSSIDPELARGIMKYHFLEGFYTSTNPLLGMETQLIHTVLRPPVLTNVSDGAVVKLTAADNENPFRVECGIQKVLPIVEADIDYDTGVLHIINDNLVLPHNLSETTNLGNLEKFWSLVKKAQMSEPLESLRDTTILLPSNEAMEKYKFHLESLVPEDLRTTINNHVIPNRVLYHLDFGETSEEVRTMSGLKLKLSRDSAGGLFVNYARVLKQDVLIYGGVSHVLDNVLITQRVKMPSTQEPIPADVLDLEEEDEFETRVFEKIQGDDFIVDWNGPDDKGNAQNLPKPRKWLVTWVLALYVLSTTFSSSVFSAAAAVTANEFDTTVQTMVFGGTSLFMLGFAVGPIIFGPLSERYGRKGPLVIGYVSFAILQLPAANAQGLFTIFVSRFLQGVFGLMYIFFLAYPMSFANERHWDSTSAGLPLLSILLGTLIGGALIILTVNTNLSPDPKADRPQENRLLLMMLGSVCLPVGMFWFAATSSPETIATQQIIAGVPIGMGIILINMQGMNYIVDCYGPFSNSAISANTFMRSLFASGFPVFATSLYSSIGVARATSFLGLFGVVLAPIPFLFFKYGEDIRSRSKWAPS